MVVASPENFAIPVVDMAESWVKLLGFAILVVVQSWARLSAVVEVMQAMLSASVVSLAKVESYEEVLLESVAHASTFSLVAVSSKSF